MDTALVMIATLSLMAPPAPAGDDQGPESIAATYFAPPDAVAFTPTIDEAQLSSGGVVAVARAIGAAEQALAQCQSYRFQMEALIGDTFGSYTVHPDWMTLYQNCLLTRHEEVTTLKRVIAAQEAKLLSGENAANAVAGADTVARLSVYRLSVEKAVVKEVAAQKAFVKYYNTGNAKNRDGVSDPVSLTPQAAPMPEKRPMPEAPPPQ